MSYNARQREAEFFIADADKPKALRALKASKDHDVLRYYKGFGGCRYLEDALEHIDFDVDTDDAGNVTGVDYQRDGLGEVFAALQPLAPFVRAGSYLEFSGEDGALWRWVFDGVKVVRVEPTITWPEGTDAP